MRRPHSSGQRLLVFDGGSAAGTDAVQAFDLRTHTGRIVGRLPRVLSDLASVQIGRTTYLVGGFDGRTPRAEVLATEDGRHFTKVGLLPVALRYPATATVGGKLVIAGGQTTAGLSGAIFSFDPATGTVTRIGRLASPLAHASAVTSGTTVYIVGGRLPSGATSRSLTAITGSTLRTTPLGGAPVADSAVATLGRTTFLIGGWSRRTLATVLKLDAR
jgi:hypothetical protein